MKFPFDLREDCEFDCVGFGTNAVDFLIRVPEYPEFDSKVELSDYSQLAGGEIATAMVGLSRLGMRTAYAGRFGKEPTGDFGIASLSDEGVDVRFAEQIEGAVTQIAFIVIDERNGERTVIWKRDPKLVYSAEEAPIEAAQIGKVLHFTPHDTAACIRLAREAKAHGTIVSIDIDNVFEGTNELLPLVDILIGSSDFVLKATGEKDKRAGLAKLNEKYGCPVTGVTLGESGSLVYCGGEFFESGGFEVPGGCKDTTGAGDSYRAGLIYGLLKGMSVEDAARSANAVAALKCRAVGARTSLPTEPELKRMIEQG
ncbi:MAG: carbohydrate kinase family protein [Acidobacteriota bacterium]|nr:MAG: carbohydrate kinase family protein [Acidobacteriota bacterium]